MFSSIVMVIQLYIAMAIPAGVFIYVMTKIGQSEGRVPPDINTKRVVLDAMVTWPKVYWLLFLGLSIKLFHWLFRASLSSPRSKAAAEHRDEAHKFAELFNRRLKDNRQLQDWLERSDLPRDQEGDIGIVVHKLAGSTYVILHENPMFLKRVRRNDGTYDEETTVRLNSLHPWMVFDLVTAHPEIKFLLPPEILSRAKK